MPGPSISSVHHEIESAYPAFYDGRICVPGGAGEFIAADGKDDEPTQMAGLAFRSSRSFKLPDNVTITLVA